MAEISAVGRLCPAQKKLATRHVPPPDYPPVWEPSKPQVPPAAFLVSDWAHRSAPKPQLHMPFFKNPIGSELEFTL